MNHLFARSLVLLITTAMVAFAIFKDMNAAHAADDSVETVKTAADANPLLAKWEGPYGGVPPFDQVQIPLFKPALEAAMTEQLAEVDRIAKNSAAPTFENTIVALERAGGTFDRVTTIYGVWGATMNGAEFQGVQRDMAPKLAAFGDQITQNESLFKRIEAVYNSPEKAKLNATTTTGLALPHKLRSFRCSPWP